MNSRKPASVGGTILSLIMLPLVCVIVSTSPDTTQPGTDVRNPPPVFTSQEPYAVIWSPAPPDTAPAAPYVAVTPSRRQPVAVPDPNTELEVDRDDDDHHVRRSPGQDRDDRTRDRGDRDRVWKIWRWLT